MTLSDELEKISAPFIDTAPIIYYIEAHPQFGPLAKQVVDAFQSETATAFTSVITLTEVLSKPMKDRNDELAEKFADFLEHGKNIGLIEISSEVPKRAGKLRGTHQTLRTVDAIQVAAAIEVGADAFITNDKSLKQVNEIKVVVLADYFHGAEPAPR